MDLKKKKTPAKKMSSSVGLLRKQVSELKSEWMRLEGDRIQLAVRYTDLMSQWSSISCTYVGAIRERDETIEKLLKSSGLPSPSPGILKNEKELRDMVFETAEKEIQTELW